MEHLHERFEKRWLESHHSRAPRLLNLSVLRDLIDVLPQRRPQIRAHKESPPAQASTLETSLRTLESAHTWALSGSDLKKLLSSQRHPRAPATRIPKQAQR